MQRTLPKTVVGAALAAILALAAFLLFRAGAGGGGTPREAGMPAEAQAQLKQSLGSVSGPLPPGAVSTR